MLTSAGAAAQSQAENWGAPHRPTTQDLLAISWGGPVTDKNFVAVGAGGTIVSANAAASPWVVRTSGTTATLRAVAQSATLAIAAGDQGTLLTSPDRILWTARDAGTTQTIRALATNENAWVAVGDGGVISSSADGLTWNATTVAGAPVLRAVVWQATNNRFLVGGDGGRLLASSDGLSFSPLSSPGTDSITALAVNPVFDEILVATNVTGRLSVSVAGAPWVTQPVGTSAFSSVAAGPFNLVAVGANGVIAFSTRGGSVTFPLPWITLHLPGSASLAAIANNGDHFVAVGTGGVIWANGVDAATAPIRETNYVPTTTFNAIAGRTAQLNVQMENPTSLAYQWEHDGIPISGATQAQITFNNVQPEHAGQYVCRVANSSCLARLHRTLHVVPSPPSTVALDPLFSGTPAPHSGTSAPLPLPDGRRIEFTLANNTLTLRRVLVGGGNDPTFSVTPITFRPPATAPNFTYARAVAALDSQDRMVVGVSGSGGFSSQSAELLRFLPDGTLDPTFQRSTFTASISELWTAADRILLTTVSTSPTLDHYPTLTFLRRRADGTADPGFVSMSFRGELSANYELPAVAPLADGSFLLLRSERTPNASLQDPINTGFNHIFWIEHYAADGTALPDRRVILALDFPTYYRGASALRAFADGSVGIWGDFVAVNGRPAAGAVRVGPLAQPAVTYLANVSIRSATGPGDDTLIAGFVVAGSGPKSVLVRSVGPGLRPFDVNGAVADPRLTLLQDTTVIADNDDWSLAANASAIAQITQQLSAFELAPASKDAALLANLSAGKHTSHTTTGPGSPAGIALAEVYDVDVPSADPAAARIINVSARARVDAGEQTLIAGFVVGGSETLRLLVRAAGPSLASMSVSNPMADPILRLYRRDELIAENNDRVVGPNLQAATQLAGAFALTSSRESALLITLEPGAYTAHVVSADGSAGIALVEVYALP